MPYRIIVADPSPTVQKTVQLVFAEPEFRVFAFEDGASLLESVADVRPDALLVSLTLPGRDGYEVGRTLRSRKELETVPLIGLKGTFESLDTDRNPPADYDEVVQKPFDSERLAAVVRELIARKTGPLSLPEEPLWPAAGGDSGAPAPAAPVKTGPADAADQGLKDWVREEMVGMEREIEKRVRARVVADLKEWMSKP
ncbi:MAG: response regulator [Acidobacteria bacterium]|nr:response regulator [Acidobacteriota bacterium]MBE3129597.1 response regulator [Acidobacteriota bacterium]